VIVDGETGALVGIDDATGLASALLRYVEEPALRTAHGQAACARARTSYARELVWARWRDEYRCLLGG